MWILRHKKTAKNEQNCPYLSSRSSIFPSEIFKIGVELPQDLIYWPGFLS